MRSGSSVGASPTEDPEGAVADQAGATIRRGLQPDRTDRHQHTCQIKRTCIAGNGTDASVPFKTYDKVGVDLYNCEFTQNTLIDHTLLIEIIAGNPEGHGE